MIITVVVEIGDVIKVILKIIYLHIRIRKQGFDYLFLCPVFCRKATVGIAIVPVKNVVGQAEGRRGA